MSKKILIDASFSDETRVALVENNKLTNLDREALSEKHLKGNIYLAKIIKIEPSLQAAFLNYGGNRHGFLPFSDIHPDYYNIDAKEKDNLSQVKFFEVKKDEENTNISAEIVDKTTEEATEATAEDFEVEDFVKLDENNEPILDNKNSPEICDNNDTNDDCDEEDIKVNNYYKNYKIEDVLKEGQLLLVQVLKEERGEKGVAMTTYISLAGKYCVLMANVEDKGGISKKITNLRDRKILKNILHTINPKEDKSIIIRTAGVGKKPEDISKDYTYLARLWQTIKQVALDSKTPIFLHSEDDIIKKTIREICDDEVEEIIVEGADAYKEIKYLTKLIIPEYKIALKLHNERTPLFNKYNIEEQIGNLYLNKIILPSGGSIVIDQTEALVAIDVNSGKATKEKNIEETALLTNVEAAKEIARQLRLRDIGGLIVIDFIDMFDSKNKRTVERTLRDATLIDKARIQIDKLSMFGLIEMSRQRLDASFRERVSEPCPHCEGRGAVRSRSLVALNIFRAIKYTAREKNAKIIDVMITENILIFLNNYKREQIKEIETNYNIKIFFKVDDNLVDNGFTISKRASLSDEEEINLNNVHPKGKVNELLDERNLYDSDDKDEQYSFNENCYFDKSEKNKQRYNNNKNYNNNYKSQKNKRNSSQKENKNLFKKIFNFWK